jgi:3-oxoacyl-[acyl-carrier-protein] synthase II
MRNFRVVITGLGLVTPLGVGVDAFWKALCAGEVATAPLTRFDASGYGSRVAAQIDDFDASAFLSRRRIQWTDRYSQFAIAASRLALEDAHYPGSFDGSQCGIFTGSALGGVAYAEEQTRAFARDGIRAIRPLLTLSVFGAAATSNIAIEVGATGPACANANSCASGAMAIGQAFRAIADGDIRFALAGGVEAPLAPISFGAFVVARAMSTRNDDPKTASRPFDRDRDGFVMAEGAGMVLLERYEDAVARNADVYAEIVGYGICNDAHHMSAPLPGGEQTARSLQLALQEAGAAADDVDAISAHGSSTRLGDSAETAAYRRVFGERIATVPVCATKGQHGHALGATGAWEVAVCALVMRDGILPGAVNSHELDADCALACSDSALQLRPKIMLSNSSGFGGLNAALVLRAP